MKAILAAGAFFCRFRCAAAGLVLWGTALLPVDLAQAQVPIICNDMQVGTLTHMTGPDGVLSAMFTSTTNGADGMPSLDAAAAACDQDHFNWYQVVTEDSDPPMDAAGNQLMPPYVDPPPGGYDYLGADNLPWYYDETPSDPSHINSIGDPLVSQDTDGNGTADKLNFFDQPNGINGMVTEVTFELYLVSINADGSFHEFPDHGGIEWKWTEAADGTRTAEHTLSLLEGPPTEFFDDIIDDFATSVPATVWDTVINNSNAPVAWGPGRWTRDGRIIGVTFPNGIIQPGIDPPEIASDHIELPETPNDFHFSVLLPAEEVQIDVWSFWDTSKDPNFEFEFDMFTVPGVQHLDVTYQLEQGVLLVQDVTDPTTPTILYQGPREQFNPEQINVGQGPGSFVNDQQVIQIMPHVSVPPLLGDFNGDHTVNTIDLDLVLLNWDRPGTELPPQWVNQIPVLYGGAHSDPLVMNVGINQLNAVLFHWGESTPVTQMHVPEPASGVLVVLVCVGGLAFRRKAALRLALVALLCGGMLHAVKAAVTDLAIVHTDVDTTAAGGTLTDHTANDILIDFTGVLGGQQLFITLTEGSIYQDPLGGSGPPAAGLFPINPDLEFDSFFALGGLTADASAPPAFAGGATALGGPGMAAFSTSTANQTWFPPGGTFIMGGADFPVARITLSNDAMGSWRFLSTTSTGNGYIADVGVGVPDAVMGNSVDLGIGADGVIAAGRLLIEQDAGTVRGVHLFYNNSGFDGNGASVDVADFAAIATDKSPLRYGETSNFENISGYSRGINGLFIDLDGLPMDGAMLDAADITLATGTGNFPDTWAEVAPASVGVLAGQGEGGSDRIFVTLVDGAITDAWLRLRIEANEDTGLAVDEDFFFGAAPGETGAGFLPQIVGVDAADLQRIGQNITPLAEFGTELITETPDVNHDRTVNAFDLQVVAINLDIDVLRHITPQMGLPPAAMGVPEPRTGVLMLLVAALLVTGRYFVTSSLRLPAVSRVT